MLKRKAGKSFYCFLDRYNRYNQIIINLDDQEKIIFICKFDMHIRECLLVFVIQLQRFKDAW